MVCTFFLKKKYFYNFILFIASPRGFISGCVAQLCFVALVVLSQWLNPLTLQSLFMMTQVRAPLIPFLFVRTILIISTFTNNSRYRSEEDN